MMNVQRIFRFQSLNNFLAQVCPEGATSPEFRPSSLMDFELEMAFFVGGPPTKLGQRIGINEADKHIFGMVIMNDWSGM